MNQFDERLKELNSNRHAKANEIRENLAVPVLRRIVEVFPHYTSHDDSHSDRLLEICVWLSGDLFDELTADELFVLHCAFFLHDCGMAITTDEKQVILKDSDYRDFKTQHPHLNEVECLAEWVRRTHHIRSADFARRELVTYLQNNDVGFINAIALLVESHGTAELEDFNKYDPFYAIGYSGSQIRLPLLGVLLRLSDLLHLTADRTPLAVRQFLTKLSEMSQREWSKHLSTVGIAPIPQEAKIRLQCVCESVDTHRNLLRLCDYVNDELRYCQKVQRLLKSRNVEFTEITYRELSPNVTAQGYEPWLDLKFRLDEPGIMRLLTGAQLYPGPPAVLKELLINAVDASRQARKSHGGCAPIIVTFNEESGVLTIDDNGIGMAKHEIEEYLLRLGQSFYRSEEFRQTYSIDNRIQPIAEFGIGFASCFMVGDKVSVHSFNGSDKAVVVEMFDLLGFAAVRSVPRSTRGTTVSIQTRPEFRREIAGAVRNVSNICPHVEIPISIELDGIKTEVYTNDQAGEARSYFKPYFRSRMDRYCIIRSEKISIPGIRGHFGLWCERTDSNVVLPAYPPHGVMQKDTLRRISQLGFTLPLDSLPHCLLKSCNSVHFEYDLDLSGDMRLELDPSRTRIQPSQANNQVCLKVDEAFVQFLIQVYHLHWEPLLNEDRESVFRSLADLVLGKLLLATHKISCISICEPLLDIFFTNLVLPTRRKGEPSYLRSLQQVQRAKQNVVAFVKYPQDTDSSVNETCNIIHDHLPDVTVIILPNKFWASAVYQLFDIEQILVCDGICKVFHVLRLNVSSTQEILCRRNEVLERRSSLPSVESWNSVLPFAGNSKYAIITDSRGPIFPGINTFSTWINCDHPKLAFLVDLAKPHNGHPVSQNPVAQFFRSVTSEDGHWAGEESYIEYLIDQHRACLLGLVSDGHINQVDITKMTLSFEDFARWDTPAH